MIVKMTSGVKLANNRMVKYLGKDNPNTEPIPEDSLNDSVMYLEKEESGQKHEIYLGGYLNIRLRQNPEYKTNHVHLMTKEWNSILEEHDGVIPKNGVGVRRFIMSPDPKKLKSFSDQSKEEIIKRTVRESMKKFKDQFYKGDQIGYIFSIHKDKDHMHAHVYLHTITKEGKYVAINASRYRNINGKLITINSSKTHDKLGTFKIMASNSFEKYRRNQLEKEKDTPKKTADKNAPMTKEEKLKQAKKRFLNRLKKHKEKYAKPNVVSDLKRVSKTTGKEALKYYDKEADFQSGGLDR